MNPSIFNTLTRKKETLRPEQANEAFKIYCCGPTVYGPAHIGNFRTFCVQDVLRRTLEASGVKVTYVRNITDVDDKTIRESMKLGMTLKDFTRKWEDKFHKDCDALNMLTPSVEPRATEHIAEQIAMVEQLVKSHHAYPTADGSVYFKISSYADYGKLSGLDTSALKTQNVNSAGDLNSADEYERENVSDFALWKGYKPSDGENFWESPWGKGRPGWHIECSAMAAKYLGESFDLHGGGIDLCFPHHENEIAQSACSLNVKSPARYWFHSAHLMVEGQKMSKSLGNLYTLDDLIAKGYTPMQVRFTLIAGHYKQQLNFTFKGLEDAKSAIFKLQKSLLQILENLKLTKEDFSEMISKDVKFDGTVFESAWNALCDDLNVPKTLGEIFTALADKSAPKTLEDVKALAGLMYALGLDIFADKQEASSESAPEEIRALAQSRWQAKKDKNFKLADEIRAQIGALGWTVLDTKDGFDLKKS